MQHEHDCFLSLRDAYACLNPECDTIQKGAPGGICRRCQRAEVAPVSMLVRKFSEPIRERLLAKRELREKQSANFAAYLTAPEHKLKK